MGEPDVDLSPNVGVFVFYLIWGGGQKSASVTVSVIRFVDCAVLPG